METILIVDDEKLIRWSLSEELSKDHYRTITAETIQDAITKVQESMPELVILDLRLPDGSGIEALEAIKKIHPEVVVIMLTAEDKSAIAVQAMKLGAYDYLTKPVRIDELKIIIEKALENIRLKRELHLLYQQQEDKQDTKRIISQSDAMNGVFKFIEKVGPTNSTVLITGESGTGKELVAQAIHRASMRKKRPMISINCGAITDTLIESEFFGHERGAFTDAITPKKGLFEIADGSTIFLDEIGDISPSLQIKLLRVLEERSFRRVGGNQDIATNVRIIAATNQRLENKITEDKFRSDLFYRLNVASIGIPPLRSRREDILVLAEYFLKMFNISYHKKFKGLTEETKNVFMNYDWPGNVRELRNTVERAMILDEGEYIFSHPVELGHLHQLSGEEQHHDSSLFSIEKDTIQKALEKSKYNQVRTARLLKISRDTLRYRMKKFGLLSKLK
jgi:two-component system response regulator AtoC